MNTCGHIRSILLTDYIDGELDNNKKKAVEEHITNCPACGRLVAMVREDMSVISGAAAKKKAPPHIWRSIVDKIDSERNASNPAADLLRALTARLTLPGLASAFAGVILIVLSASFFIYTQYIRQGYGNENLNYVSELFTNAGSAAATEHEGLGTPIEEYFL